MHRPDGRPAAQAPIAQSPVIVMRPVEDTDALREPVHGADLDCTQMKPGALQGMLFLADLNGLNHSAGVFNNAVHFNGRMAPKEVSLVALLDQIGGANVWGQACMAGDVIVFPANTEVDACYQGPTSYAALLMTQDDICTASVPFENLSEPAIWVIGARHRIPLQARGEMVRRLRGCVAVAQMMGSTLSARAVTLLREEMLETFLTALASAEARRVVQQPPVSSARIVSQVQCYLGERQDNFPHLLEVCRDLHLSRRTLHRAFNDVFGVGPKTFLKLKSLSAARAALLASGSTGCTVTQIALSHGFFELGRFSVMYRRMFGESPSQTVKRAPLGPMQPAAAHTTWRDILIEGLPPEQARAKAQVILA